MAQLPISSPDAPKPHSDESFLASLEKFFEYVHENERLFRILIIQRDSSNFNQRLVTAVMEKYHETTQNNNLTDRYAYTYCVNGVIGIMREWIINDFPISTQSFTEIALKMSNKTLDN